MNARLLPLFCLGLSLFTGSASAAATATALHPASVWQRAEFRLGGLPASTNPFDPAAIRVDAAITAPSGATFLVPAFWYQHFDSTLRDGAEVLTASGEPEWRLRFTPTEAGAYRFELLVGENNSPPRSVLASTFEVGAAAASAPPSRGWVRVAKDRRYFETSDGTPLRLIGENVCWPRSRGTVDYAEWFGAMRESGQNFARLWMAPWWAGLEHTPGTLTNYKLDAAWQLDRVFELAEQNHLQLLLCFDHHGMYMANDPAWGGSNNFWGRSNPYAVENGGPAKSPNDFFTDPKAREIYQKRLRYLIARYGGSPNLLAWQFFNEIDNSYIPRSNLVAADVVAWHRDMAQWLRAHDPYRHLITTSLTGGSDRADMWQLPELDFTMYHSYADPSPGKKIALLSEDFVQRYKKPVMIGEFGVNAANWARPLDPHLRGFRQSLWSGALGGSVGTSMTWWWEDVHDDRAYALFRALHTVLDRAGWQQGAWSPLPLPSSSPPPGIGPTIRGGETFSTSVALNPFRRIFLPGEAAIPDPLAAERASELLSGYLRGRNVPADQQRPIRLTAHFGAGARLVLHLDATGSEGELVIRAGDGELARQTIAAPPVSGATSRKLDREIAVDLPAGLQRIEILNTGADWLSADSLRLQNVRYATHPGNWEMPPEFVGLRQDGKAVLYVNSPWMVYPAGALRYDGPLQSGRSVTLADWPAGTYRIEFFDPQTGATTSSRDVSTREGKLTVPLADFSDDLALIVTPASR